MKIHIFIARMGIGGAERVCVNLANEFVRKGNEVHIVVLNLKNDVNTHLLDKRVQVHSLEVSRLRYSFPAMLRYVKKFRPPFLLVFGNEMAVILNKLKKLHLIKTPIIVRVLNNVNISLSKEDNVSPIVENYLKKAQKQLADMNYVIAQCDAMKEMLLEKKLLKEDRLTRVYNPVSAELIAKTMELKIPFDKREKERVRQIVFIGRLDPQKNLPHLIEAFAMVNKQMPATILRLIGNGNLTEAIRSMVEEKGLSDRVNFDGICKNMETVYSEADMIVLSSEYEGMPNCLIESIGCGVPIVSYDCPIGPREIVVDDVNGYLVKYNDITQLAEKMLACLQREWNEEEIRKTAGKFDVSYIADEYLELFDKVICK